MQPEKDLSRGNFDPFEQNQRLGAGVNLGNALEAPQEGDWGVVLMSEYFDLIKQAGFQSVRIPIRWSAHTTTAPPFAIDSRFFDRVDWAIEQAFSRSLAVIINIHHYEEIMQDALGHKARFLAIWDKIAAHYQNHPADLFFEILNEPNSNLSPDRWNQFLNEAIAVIRKTNTDRTLLVGTANWGGAGSLQNLVLPEEDRNIIVTVHYYNPFQFTHQGAEWVSGSNVWLGTTWTGTDAEKQTVINDFWSVANWSKLHNRPLNLGEFGAYSKADMDSRVRWTAFVTRTAEANGMSWHYWEFIAGFGVLNNTTNDWNIELLKALVPSS
ncbi:MAG: glycoside hydrolase family 5 protein [bacterium]